MALKGTVIDALAAGSVWERPRASALSPRPTSVRFHSGQQHRVMFCLSEVLRSESKLNQNRQVLGQVGFSSLSIHRFRFTSSGRSKSILSGM
jgi:hypothetical protein